MTIENRGGAGAEVPVVIQTAVGERVVRVLVNAHQKASGRSQVPAPPTKVVVNDGSVPEINSEDNIFERTGDTNCSSVESAQFGTCQRACHEATNELDRNCAMSARKRSA